MYLVRERLHFVDYVSSIGLKLRLNFFMAELSIEMTFGNNIPRLILRIPQPELYTKPDDIPWTMISKVLISGIVVEGPNCTALCCALVHTLPPTCRIAVLTSPHQSRVQSALPITRRFNQKLQHVRSIGVTSESEQLPTLSAV